MLDSLYALYGMQAPSKSVAHEVKLLDLKGFRLSKRQIQLNLHLAAGECVGFSAVEGLDGGTVEVSSLTITDVR
jgi:hypothetical protein